MAIVSFGIISKLTCSSTFPRISRRSVMLLVNTQRFAQPLVPPVVCMNRRWATYGRKHVHKSKFPPEDAVTRLEELSKKLNPYDKRLVDTELPDDHGFKHDSTGQIFSQYIPKDDKSPSHLWTATKTNLKKTYALAVIKRKESKTFNSKEFAQQAQKKFIDLNNDLQLKVNKSIELRMEENATLVVVKALKEQFQNPGKKVYWRFVKELESPKIVNALVVHVGDKTNLYAQITVRMFTEQILAIRDRYDRLIVGSLKNPKKVTDYVVFERHLPDPYGNWRICGKING